MVREHKPTPRDNQRKERVATIALCFIRGRTRVQREEDRSPCTNHAHAESHRGLPRNTRVRYASFTRVKETAGSASRTLTEFESDWYWLDQIVVGVFILISSQYVCSTALFELEQLQCEALTICTYLFELLPVHWLGHVKAMHSALLGGRSGCRITISTCNLPKISHSCSWIMI